MPDTLGLERWTLTHVMTEVRDNMAEAAQACDDEASTMNEMAKKLLDSAALLTEQTAELKVLDDVANLQLAQEFEIMRNEAQDLLQQVLHAFLPRCVLFLGRNQTVSSALDTLILEVYI